MTDNDTQTFLTLSGGIVALDAIDAVLVWQHEAHPETKSAIVIRDCSHMLYCTETKDKIQQWMEEAGV